MVKRRNRVTRNPAIVLAGNPPLHKVENIGSNMTEVWHGDIVALISYQTPVAFKVRSTGLFYRSGEYHSNTTSKHISKWFQRQGADKSKAVLLSQYEVERVLESGEGSLTDGDFMKRLLKNPARTGPLSRGEIMSQRVYEVRYRHKDDGKDYKHDFGAGVKMEAMPDGSIRLYHDTLRLWGDF